MKQWQVSNNNDSGSIYVIGIVNAGKSTFINLLLRKLFFSDLSAADKILETDTSECTYIETEISLHPADNEKYIINSTEREYKSASYSDDGYKIIETQSECFNTKNDFISRIRNTIKENNSISEDECKYKYVRMPRPIIRGGKFIIKELTGLNISIYSTKMKEYGNVILVDTPGFNSESYSDKNKETLENLKNATKVLFVTNHKLEAKAIPDVLKDLSVRYSDLPITLICNIRDDDFKNETIKTTSEILSELIKKNKQIVNSFLINLESVLTEKKDGLDDYDDGKIKLVHNGELNTDIVKQMFYVPLNDHKNILREILEKDYSDKLIKTENILLKDINKEVESYKVGVMPDNVSGELSNDDLDIRVGEIKKYLKNKLSDAKSDGIYKIVWEDDKDHNKIMVWHNRINEQLNRNELKESIKEINDEINSIITLTEVTVKEKIFNIKYYNIDAKSDDYMPVWLSNFHSVIIEGLEKGKSNKEIVNELEPEFHKHIVQAFEEAQLLWKEAINSINKLYIKYKINKTLRDFMLTSRRKANG